MEIIKVTELEKQVLQALALSMYAEEGFSDVGIEEIEEITQLSSKVIRGVGSSLVKKGLIHIDNRDGEYVNNPRMFIWYLDTRLYGMVKIWRENNPSLKEVQLITQ